MLAERRPEAATLPHTRWGEGLAPIAEHYDGFVIDQFGVLHDGRSPYPGAAAALRTLRARGQRVIVLSNSGKRAAVNAQRLAQFDVDPASYDRLVTSGELCWQLLGERDRPPFDGFGDAVLLIHPAEDRPMVEGLGLREVERVADASFVLLASLAEEQTPDRLRPLLRQAAARRLPLVCANPDRLRLTGAGVRPASGSVAALYEELGGPVTWIGKPHALIYAACREQFAAWGAARVCAIGDSLEHDVGGGAAAGFDTCFIAGGLHAAQFQAAGSAGRDAQLARLLVTPHAASVPAPTWALPTLCW